MARYDAHHILKYLHLRPNEVFSAIARTGDTFISFSIKIQTSEYTTKQDIKEPIYSEARFLDSFQFMSQGLDDLAKTMELDDLKHLRSKFSYLSDENFPTPNVKSAFLLCYLGSLTKFSASFPPLGNDWKNSLSGKLDIVAKDHQTSIEIYHLFSCTTFGEYHDIYLILDVYLLSDIFETFRNVCMSVYELDPVHFFSAPNLSWEAMLITTKVQIELLPDIDMLLFCENAIRGGINGIGAHRTFSANNKYMQNYKANEESVFGAFFDVTSLYAGTIERPLPLGDYVWRSDLTLNDILSADPFGDIGYMVEKDLHNPSYLHSLHNDLPRAPQILQINPDWLSSYALSFGLKPSSTAKLVATFSDKLNYVCHFRNLQFCVQQGLQVKALHEVLQLSP